MVVQSNTSSGKFSKSSYQAQEPIKVIQTTDHGICVVRRLNDPTSTQRKFMSEDRNRVNIGRH